MEEVEDEFMFIFCLVRDGDFPVWNFSSSEGEECRDLRPE